MSNLRDKNWPDGQGRVLDAAGRVLAGALDDARDRLPDDVTMRRLWARVSQPELAVAAEPARPPRWIWFAGGVASTAALAFAFVFGFGTWHGARREVAQAPKATTIIATTASTESTPTEAPAMPAAEGTVRTGVGERLALALAGGAEARLESSSVLTVAHDGHAVVDRGEVSFTVTRREHARPYVVMAGPYRVVVLGARFRLSLDETRRVRVDAEDGVAEVWDQGRVARLGAGESWTSPATVTAPHTRGVALATPGSEGVGVDPEARAQAALAAGDVTRALGLYRALAKHGGPASENAAYEVGKLLRDRLGQPANAVAAWRHYRADHPDGILRVETDVSIIETLVHAGDTNGALGEANDFLRNHPDSERRAEIARVAGDLHRVRGDLKRAVFDYQISLASPKSRDAEAATFHRAECLVRLGDPSGGEAARDYLRRWPEGRFRADAERLLTGGDDDGATRL